MNEKNENISNSSEPKNEDLQQSKNKEINKSDLNNSKLFLSCMQSNFTITSGGKIFNSPLNIEKLALNYIPKKTITVIEQKSKRNNIIPINNTSIFIGGRQNLKGMRIHLSNNYKYNNTVHREITDFRNSKNKSVDKVNVRLTENKPIEKVSINLCEKNNQNENKNENDITNALKMMLIRWKNFQKITKINLSYINKEESFVLNKKNYVEGLKSKIIINSNKSKNKNSTNNNNLEKYILIKQDKYNKDNSYISEIISPSSNEELETSISSFIYKISDNKENQNNNSNTNSSDNLSKKENYLYNGKKKSKFSNKKLTQFQNIKSDNTTNNNMLKGDFCPIFIFTKKDIQELYEMVNIKPINNNNKPKKINYTIENKIFFNIINQNKNNNEKLRAKNENKKEKNLDEINFNIFPVKGDKFEIINIVPNEIRTNYNIDVSNIQLNQSDYMKQVKGGENDFEYLLNKNKEMEDFSQNTPISLLQEKYFIYAVSKWIKYSIPNPQSQLYIKYSYKTGHPMFDPINLIMTNFTLWIERIETKRNDNKKAMISISSSVNFNNSLKNNKNQRGKSSNKKKGYVNIYSNQSNNYINDNNNNSNKKRNNSKSKVYK